MQYNNRTVRLSPRLAMQLAAPHTWAASVCPALFGILFCRLRELPLSPLKGVLLLCACTALQSAVNTLNDYVDFVRGADSPEDHVEVSDATLVYSGLAPRSARNLGLAYLAAGLLLGLWAAWGMGPAPILIGLAGALAILLYSGGPLPVSYLPLGEAVSGFVMGGLIPLGIAACADGQAHWELLGWSLPLVLSIALIMMSNNGCDIEKDLRSGRNTLPALLGRGRTLALYRCSLGLWLALLSSLSLALTGWAGLVCIALLAAFWRGGFRKLFRLGLRPEERVAQMKAIAAANLLGNGAYIAAVLVKIVTGEFHV